MFGQKPPFHKDNIMRKFKIQGRLQKGMVRTSILLLSVCVATVCFAVDESQEPPLSYTLTIDGRNYQITLDQPLLLEGNYKNPKLTLAASPLRRFPFGGVEFHYPAKFSWEAEIESAKFKQWILSGNDFKIMYFVQSDIVTLDSYVDAMVRQFGKEKTRISNTERVLGRQLYTGKLLFVKIAGTSINFEIFTLPSKEGSRLLVLQDSPPDNRALSVEGDMTLKMLTETFKDTLAPNKPDAGGGK
jgi:hypothetical protein